jgi:AcrR family transcriptional regulator
MDSARLSQPSDDTRARLLKAAAEVFAECGYENATIRQICSRARANIALVNYHFGDKMELYTAVLKSSSRPRPVQAPPPETPEAALRETIRAMIEKSFECGSEASLRYRLVLHELMRPTAATARVVDVAMRPMYDRLREIVASILNLPADHERTKLTVHGIIGQVAYFARSTPVLTALWPGMKMTPPQRALVALHIADVTLAYLDKARAQST